MRTSLAALVLGCCLLAGAPIATVCASPAQPMRALSQPAARASHAPDSGNACAGAHKHPHAAEHAGAHASHSRQLHAATNAQVIALFPAWNASLQTKDPLKVADMYTADGMLLPTVSNKVGVPGGAGLRGARRQARAHPQPSVLVQLLAATPGMRHAPFSSLSQRLSTTVSRPNRRSGRRARRLWSTLPSGWFV
jgi:hypothetical protein